MTASSACSAYSDGKLRTAVTMVTNEQVYDFYKKMREGNCSTISIIDGFKEHFELFCSVEKCQYRSVYNKIVKVYDKITDFNKKKLDKQKLEFLYAEFKLPLQQSNFERSLATSSSEKELNLKKTLHSVKSENKILKRKLENKEQDNFNIEIELQAAEEKYTKKISELKEISSKVLSMSRNSILNEEKAKVELQKLQETFEKQSGELDQLQSAYSDLRTKLSSSKVRNVNKKLKRRDEKIKDLENKVNTLGEPAVTNSENEKIIRDLGQQIRKLQFKVSYQKRKLVEQKENCENDNLVKDIDNLNNQISLLKKEKQELQELLSLFEDEEIITFQDGRYCDEVRETIMELLSLNVSMSKINDVIRIVLKKLANKQVGRLPSIAVQSRLLVEARHLAHVQVTEAMLQNKTNEFTGNCLHGDGTSKYHRHYQNFQVTLKSGKTLSLGLKELAGGDSASIMKAFNDTIGDLSSAISGTNMHGDLDEQMLIQQLVTSIKSTMSDRGAVNPCFNAQLKVLRESFLPDVVDNWENLESDVKKSISDMCNFFCKMHLLPNMATETDKILKIFEDVALLTKESQFSYQTGESGSARLVRTAAKAFHPMGSDEAGVASYFESFLNGKNEKLKIVSFRGSRFNILFYDAAATFYHRQHIVDFLKTWPNPNNLLEAVEEDILNPVYIAALRALGIVDKIITGPFWRIIENKSSVLELNPFLLQMKLSFDNWSKDASGLLEGERLFADIPVHEDELYRELFRTSEGEKAEELDTLTIQCLEMIMHALLIIVERQAEEQLPGGKYYQPSESIKMIASNVPTSNKVSEKEFASLDLLIRIKPNARIISNEALIMWTHNKTLQWLESKSENEKKTASRASSTKF